jgi:antitoxin ParD1/3/4
MNVNLTPTLEEFVKEKVASGLYNNASEVIREALRHAVQREEFEALRNATASGLSQLRTGKTVPCDLAAIKRRAVRNAKNGRAVNPLVRP